MIEIDIAEINNALTERKFTLVREDDGGCLTVSKGSWGVDQIFGPFKIAEDPLAELVVLAKVTASQKGMFRAIVDFIVIDCEGDIMAGPLIGKKLEAPHDFDFSRLYI